MEFDLTKLQEAAYELAQKAANGAKDVAQKGKEAYRRVTLENKLSKVQRQLGAYYYNQVRLGAEHESAIAECIADIDSILEELNALEAEPQAVPAEQPEEEGASECPTCGNTLPEGAVFCPQCGTKL